MKKSIFVKETEAALKKMDSDFWKKILVFDALDSTNTLAKELAKAGEGEGTIVIGRIQNHGRGRFERTWESPDGGVYLSLILRPHGSIEKTSLLPFVAALAVSKTIDSYGLHATIKWPNDVRVNGKKIAGILLELEGNEAMLTYVVVGIGINLNVDLKALSPDIQPRSTTLSVEVHSRIDYHDFLKTFCVQFESMYNIFQEQQYSRIIDDWKVHTDTLGRIVKVQTSTETLQGRAVDIDQSGFLLLKMQSGEIKKILSGDCLYLDELCHT